jgi:hypothetical protein
LAYVGASLTLLLLVAAQDVPLDHMIYQAFVAEEDRTRQLKLRLPAQSLRRQTGIQPTKVGFAAVGAVSTFGWLRRQQHVFALRK